MDMVTAIVAAFGFFWLAFYVGDLRERVKRIENVIGIEEEENASDKTQTP